MAPSATSRRQAYAPPPEFRPNRSAAVGRYPLLEVFPGLTETLPFRKYPGDDDEIRRIVEATSAHIYDGLGWMYVAPRKTPVEVKRAGFQMVESPDDVIVVSRSHLAKSPPMYVYLDIIHEFLHILQRKQGRELWTGVKVPYVDRPTEVEAYSFSIAEARRLGVPDAYLRKYLFVSWVSRSDYLRLLRNVGVSAPARSRKSR